MLVSFILLLISAYISIRLLNNKIGFIHKIFLVLNLILLVSLFISYLIGTGELHNFPYKGTVILYRTLFGSFYTIFILFSSLIVFLNFLINILKQQKNIKRSNFYLLSVLLLFGLIILKLIHKAVYFCC